LAGIYISGGSGIGKTTFVRIMAQNYGINMVTDVIRSMHKKHPDIRDLPFAERQLIYTIEFIKLHHLTDRFLTDRSIFDVLAWSGTSVEMIKYLGIEMHVPDLIIMCPLPSFAWYQHNIDYFTHDLVRLSAYKEKAGKKGRLSEDDAASMIYELDRTMRNGMIQMCDTLNWPLYLIDEEIDRRPEKFQASWQRMAEKAVCLAWEIPRPTLDDLEGDAKRFMEVKMQMKAEREGKIPPPAPTVVMDTGELNNDIPNAVEE
jgi:hypothetical protein